MMGKAAAEADAFVQRPRRSTLASVSFDACESRRRASSGRSLPRPLLSQCGAAARNCDNVGERLAKRKLLFNRRRSVAEAGLAAALLGLGLMLVHNELVLRRVYNNSSSGAILLKSVISVTSLLLCALVTWFNYVHYKLYMIDNSVTDWRLVVDIRKVATFALEIAVCLIHPIPGDWDFHIAMPPLAEPFCPPPENSCFGGTGAAQDSPTQPKQRPRLSTDVVLSIPMFLRLYLFCRVLLLRSKLFADVRSQSLGALNRTKFNFYFIFKSLMYVHPASSLAFVTFCIFAINAWAMRLCEVGHEALRADYLNALWLIAITFTSVGYGDVVPATYCGRLISVVTGTLGAGCTALTCAVLAQKIELSRAEKSVNNFVIELELARAQKEAAASIIANGWRVHKARSLATAADRGGGRWSSGQAHERDYGGCGGCGQHTKRRATEVGANATSSSEARLHACERRLLRSIAELQSVRSEQRKMADTQVTIMELHHNQATVAESLESIVDAQEALERSLDDLRLSLTSISERLIDVRRTLLAKKRSPSGCSSAAAAGVTRSPNHAES